MDLGLASSPKNQRLGQAMLPDAGREIGGMGNLPSDRAPGWSRPGAGNTLAAFRQAVDLKVDLLEIPKLGRE